MHETNTQMLQRYAQCWDSHDVEGLVALLTEDIVYEDAALGWTHHGIAEFREFAAKVFAMHPDFSLRYLDAFATETRGAAEWIIETSFEGEFEGVQISGGQVSFRGATLFEIRDGRICRNRDLWNYADWMRQLDVTRLADATRAASAG
jgi:steroid delta-isomerase-like uncharacterized protein